MGLQICLWKLLFPQTLYKECFSPYLRWMSSQKKKKNAWQMKIFYIHNNNVVFSKMLTVSISKFKTSTANILLPNHQRTSLQSFQILPIDGYASTRVSIVQLPCTFIIIYLFYFFTYGIDRLWCGVWLASSARKRWTPILFMGTAST